MLIVLCRFKFYPIAHSILYKKNSKKLRYSKRRGRRRICECANPATQKTRSGKLQLITVGSVTERKGQRNVINALPTIVTRFPQVCYHMVGQPVLKKELNDLIVEKKLNAHIKFHGAVSRKELIQLLADADIKLMLSTNTSSATWKGSV
jgi:glycosyltransferase involved in cell wall biosynthesis